MSQVRGFASWTIAPAMKTGVRSTMSATCPNETTENAFAPRCASCRMVVSEPSKFKRSTAIMIARKPART